MNEYQQRIEEKREKMLARADRLEAQATHLDKRARQMSNCMNGQPILVGHHSEKRHRRDIKRRDGWDRKSIECYNEAKELRRRAGGLGEHGIASEDPEAVLKLRDKIAQLEEDQARRKELNKTWRTAGKPRPGETRESNEAWAEWVKTTGLGPGGQAQLARGFEHYQNAPFPNWQLSNANANLRRYRQRLEALQREAQREPTDDVELEHFTVSENTEEGRLQVFFPARTTREEHKMMRTAGFVFSRRNGCYQRKLNNGARHGATWAHQLISEHRKAVA